MHTKSGTLRSPPWDGRRRKATSRHGVRSSAWLAVHTDATFQMSEKCALFYLAVLLLGIYPRNNLVSARKHCVVSFVYGLNSGSTYHLDKSTCREQTKSLLALLLATAAAPQPAPPVQGAQEGVSVAPLYASVLLESGYLDLILFATILAISRVMAMTGRKGRVSTWGLMSCD